MNFIGCKAMVDTSRRRVCGKRAAYVLISYGGKEVAMCPDHMVQRGQFAWREIITIEQLLFRRLG